MEDKLKRKRSFTKNLVKALDTTFNGPKRIIFWAVLLFVLFFGKALVARLGDILGFTFGSFTSWTSENATKLEALFTNLGLLFLVVIFGLIAWRKATAPRTKK